MRDELFVENARGTPPVVLFVTRAQATWPTLRITDNLNLRQAITSLQMVNAVSG